MIRNLKTIDDGSNRLYIRSKNRWTCNRALGNTILERKFFRIFTKNANPAIPVLKITLKPIFGTTCNTKLFCIRSTKISWSMVSNAEERSNRTSITTLPLLSSLDISFLTLSRAVSVLWRDLYADWNVSPSPFIWKCCLNLETAVYSRILPRVGRLDTGW